MPRLLTEGDYLRTLRDILEELEGLGRSGTFTDVQEEILARIACHSVVRGSHPLTSPEIDALFAADGRRRVFQQLSPRPPCIRRIGLAEIEKMFKRTVNG